MKRQHILSIVLVVCAIAFTALIYNRLPLFVPSHWNIAGEVDGMMPKATHVWLFLGICVAIPLLTTFAPKIDPKYKNIQTFEEEYSWFVVSLTAFFVGLYAFTTLWALGYRFPINYFIIPAFSLLFYSIGTMLQFTKRNYTIGFKLPWTLESDKNWDLTHKLAAKTFQYGALAILLTTFLGNFAFYIFFVIILVISIVPAVYSYRLHKQGI